MTRTEARAAGLKHYTGKPCPRGHTRRYTINCSCADCDKASQQVNSEARGAYLRYWYAANLERGRELSRRASKRYRAKYPERHAKAVLHDHAIWLNTVRLLYTGSCA